MHCNIDNFPPSVSHILYAHRRANTNPQCLEFAASLSKGHWDLSHYFMLL